MAAETSAAEPGRPGKRAKASGDQKAKAEGTADAYSEVTDAIIGLCGQDGNQVGPPLKVPLSIEPKNLEVLVNKLLGDEDGGGDGGGPLQPYSFFINEVELLGDLRSHLHKHGNSLESLQVTFKPQAWFKVLPVSRCSATMTGHSESVLSVHFSPDGENLASGSGDTTVRLWDLNTQTRLHECKGHTNWVLVVSWSPDCAMVASGGVDKVILLWDPQTGQRKGTLKGHKDSVTSICWEPAHLRLPSKRFCSSSMDKSLRVWGFALIHLHPPLSFPLLHLSPSSARKCRI